MKQGIKMIVFAAVFLVLCTSAVSAFTVERYISNPPGTLAPDTPVTVSYDVEFVYASGTTFPPEKDLVMTTELVNPKWMYTLILEGVDNPGRTPAAGQTLELSGFELSFRSNVNETVRVTLTGTTPGVSTPSSKKILDIYEINNLGNITTATRVTKTALVSNVPQATQTIYVSSFNIIRTTPAPAETTIQATVKTAQQNDVLDQVIGRVKSLFGLQS